MEGAYKGCFCMPPAGAVRVLEGECGQVGARQTRRGAERAHVEELRTR